MNYYQGAEFVIIAKYNYKASSIQLKLKNELTPYERPPKC